MEAGVAPILLAVLVGLMYISVCASGYAKHGGLCYKAFAQYQDWNGAKSACQMDGASLVKDTSLALHNFLVNSVIQPVNPYESYWIGLHDAYDTQIYTWVDGSSIGSFTHWGPGEPNHDTQDCVQLWSSNGLMWDNDFCDWSHYFICEKASMCSMLSAPANGGMTGTNCPGETVTFTCNTGYSLSGASSLLCQTSLTWSGSTPTCTPIMCPTLFNPTNGQVTGSFSYGSTVFYSCYAGYNLNGPSSRTCQITGTWTGYDPTCTGKMFQ
ncbi:E-selectin-like [Branchiostoma floridae x Branchiostoma belcheri]